MPDTAVLVAIITGLVSLTIGIINARNNRHTVKVDREGKLLNGYDKYSEGLALRINQLTTTIVRLEDELDEERKLRRVLEGRVQQLETELVNACTERDKLRCELRELKGEG